MLKNQDGQCLLRVQDYGIGIPEADQGRLFAPFQRGHNVGAITGTGLGLAIVKQAVELLRGAIRIESQIGKGATVLVTFLCSPPGI